MLSAFMKCFRFIRTMKGRMFLFASLAVAFAAVGMAATCMYVVRQDLVRQSEGSLERRMNVFRVLLSEKGTEFRVKDGKMTVGDHVLNDSYEVVDKLKQQMGGAYATVFMGDTRISTNVVKEDGSRAVGTKLDGPARKAVFDDGETFKGETRILGIPYLTRYEPVKDASGKTIGALFVGVKKSDFFSAYNRMLSIAGIVAVLLATVFGGLTFLSVRLMIAPLEAAAEVASRFAEGDLTATMDRQSADTEEVRRIVDAVENLGEKLRSTIGKVADWSHDLAAAAEQLSASAVRIDGANRKVNDQTGSVAAASEQMNATVAQVAMNTRSVQDASDKALEAASGGASVIESFIAAMGEIGNSVERAAATVEAVGGRAKEIGGVTVLIDDIADQTNLLALNAAIEAARAGESGRGFAVVADEVRKLAEKTQKATAQIAKAIGAVQSESGEAIEAMRKGCQAVEQSAALGEQAKAAMAGIRERVGDSSGRNREISTATEELNVTIRDLSRNIEAVSHAVGQNAEGTSEVAQTAEAVARRAAELKASVAGFRIARPG
ncbi:MAG: methyl-accepting chemotaxis protein [Thermodesulfobacteriota bacterium]